MSRRNRWLFMVVVIVALAIVGTYTWRIHVSDARKNVQIVHYYSQDLRKNMQIDVYLPPGYSKTKTYPVLLFFHGKDSNADSAFSSLHLNTDADRLIREGRIKPLIIVSPEIDNSYGVNSANHTYASDGYSYGKYDDYIEKELIPYINQQYPIAAGRQNHYVGGFSMGGFVALRLALLHPQEFSKVGGHSAALWVNPNTVPALLMKQADKQLFQLAQTQNLSGLSFYLDHGTSGVPLFASGLQRLDHILQVRHIPVQLHTGPGRHDDAYWRKNATNYLLFYAGTTS